MRRAFFYAAVLLCALSAHAQRIRSGEDLLRAMRERYKCNGDVTPIDLTGITDTGVYNRVDSKPHESHPCFLTDRNIRPLPDSQLPFISTGRAERSRSVLQ